MCYVESSTGTLLYMYPLLSIHSGACLYYTSGSHSSELGTVDRNWELVRNGGTVRPCHVLLMEQLDGLLRNIADGADGLLPPGEEAASSLVKLRADAARTAQAAAEGEASQAAAAAEPGHF